MTPVTHQTLRWSILQPGTVLDFGSDEQRARKVFAGMRERAGRGNGGEARLFCGAECLEGFDVAAAGGN